MNGGDTSGNPHEHIGRIFAHALGLRATTDEPPYTHIITPSAPEGDDDQEPTTDVAPELLVKLTLVPVEVFTGMCDHDGCTEDHGYGICDAVSAWSDCNRARGCIYRVEDLQGAGRLPGETINVWVSESDLPWFQKRFGE